jgi:hypothetical protein
MQVLPQKVWLKSFFRIDEHYNRLFAVGNCQNAQKIGYLAGQNAFLSPLLGRIMIRRPSFAMAAGSPLPALDPTNRSPPTG